MRNRLQEGLFFKISTLVIFSDLMDDLVISHVLSNNKLIKLTLRNVQLQNSLFFILTILAAIL